MNDLLLENPNLNFHVSDQYFTQTSQYVVSELTAVTSAGTPVAICTYYPKPRNELKQYAEKKALQSA